MYCLRSLGTFHWHDSDLKIYHFKLNPVHKPSTDPNETEVILCSFDLTAPFHKNLFVSLCKFSGETLHTIRRSFQLKEDRIWIVVLDNNQKNPKGSSLSIFSFELLSEVLANVATGLMSDSKWKKKHNTRCKPTRLVILKLEIASCFIW